MLHVTLINSFTHYKNLSQTTLTLLESDFLFEQLEHYSNEHDYAECDCAGCGAMAEYE